MVTAQITPIAMPTSTPTLPEAEKADIRRRYRNAERQYRKAHKIWWFQRLREFDRWQIRQRAGIVGWQYQAAFGVREL